MGQVSISGSLVAGPPSVSGGFPTAQTIVQLSLSDGLQKSYDFATGVLQQQITSPGVFKVLSTAAVERGTFLYLRSDAPIDLRYTHDDGSGGDVVVLLPSQGLVVLEFQNEKPLKLLEARGSALLEYFVSGPAT